MFDIDGGAAPPTTREPYLTPAEYSRALDVFTVFGSLSFCNTITMGKTQNSNESLHNMLWHNSPKSKHVGQKSLSASTALAVLSFKDGSMAYSKVIHKLGLIPSHHTLQFFSRRDRTRNLMRSRRVKEIVPSNDGTNSGGGIVEKEERQASLRVGSAWFGVAAVIRRIGHALRHMWGPALSSQLEIEER